MRTLNRLTALVLACALAIPALCAEELPELGDAAGDDLSLLTEKKIGQQIMHEIRWRDPSYLDDPDVETYLNQVGSRLASASSDPGIGFYFFPVNDRSINAFAMPGGFIGVNTGLLLASQTESELAGVLAHEVSHVTQRHIARQLSRERQVSTASMIGMAVAILAARSSSQAMGAAVVSSQASMVSAQLAFSRDFEREADRKGFETLGKAGFDVRGMSAFFERLQRATRVYENNAPVYLRSHPLTGERISDMQNREQGVSYRQVPDSIEFQLVRARLRAMQGTPPEAVKDLLGAVGDRKFASAAAAQYGLAVAQFRAKNWGESEKAVQTARKLGAVSPMVDRLMAETRIAKGDMDGGLALYRDTMARYPLNLAVAYGYGDALLAAGRYEDGLRYADSRLQSYPMDIRFYKLKAKSHAALGQQASQHRALAEVYSLQGQTEAAVEQLQWAQRAGDANFYELSAIDARMRELKQRHLEELKERHK